MFCIATAERKHCHGKRLKRALLWSGIVWTEATSLIHSQGEESAAWKWEWSGKQIVWAPPPDVSIIWAGCEDLINNNFIYCQLHFLHHTRLPSQDTRRYQVSGTASECCILYNAFRAWPSHMQPLPLVHAIRAYSDTLLHWSRNFWLSVTVASRKYLHHFASAWKQHFPQGDC